MLTSQILLEAATILLLLAVALPIAYRLSLPYEATGVAQLFCGSKGGKDDKPRLCWWRLRRTRYVWLIAWRMPAYATASRYLVEREAIETRLNCSVEIWERGGLVWMRFGVNPLPREIRYEAFYGS